MRRSRSKPKLLGLSLGLVCLLMLSAGVGFYSASEWVAAQEKSTMISTIEAPSEEQENENSEDPTVRYPHAVPRQSNLSQSLRSLGVSAQTVHQIVEATKPVFDLSRIPSGVRFKLIWDQVNEGAVQEIEFYFSSVDSLSVKRTGESWRAEMRQEKVETLTRTYTGNLDTTLWQSALDAQMDPALITELSEVFASQVDFSREVRVNDRWRISVEEFTVKGKHYRWGAILAAEYMNAGTLHTALLYRDGGRNLGYFTPKGESLRKMFLKSPLKFGRISSRFQRARFHPILKIKRPHLGVDYAAPTGTPVRSVGDGTVTFAAWQGGGGLSLKIRHGGTYQTVYRHLSRIAKGVRSGSRVQQGDLIGFVGSTGLSTAPHLHFEFFVNGRVVDPLGQKFPSADPLNRQQLKDFEKIIPVLMASLPNWDGTEAEASGLQVSQIDIDIFRNPAQPSPLSE